MVEAVDESR